MPTSWQCLVIFITSSEDLRLEKFLKPNRDLEKLCVLNQRFDGAEVGGGGDAKEERPWSKSLEWRLPGLFEPSDLQMAIGGSEKNPTRAGPNIHLSVLSPFPHRYY